MRVHIHSRNPRTRPDQGENPALQQPLIRCEPSQHPLRVLAGIAYYRNWSALYEDDDTTATDTDEIDGLFAADTATCSGLRHPLHGDQRRKTSVELPPRTPRLLPRHALIELSGLPYWLLIRSVTDRRDGSEYRGLFLRGLPNPYGGNLYLSASAANVKGALRIHPQSL